MATHKPVFVWKQQNANIYSIWSINLDAEKKTNSTPDPSQRHDQFSSEKVARLRPPLLWQYNCAAKGYQTTPSRRLG
jgi:hypothetical protein